MTQTRQEIAVGIALVVAVLVLLVGMLWLQQFQLRGQEQTVRAMFPTVGGLGKGDPVHVLGIPMGEVMSVDLEAKGVVVTMSVDRKVHLTDEAKFLLGTQGLVGERFVGIDPGHGKPVRDLEHRIFAGQYEPAATEMVGQLSDLNNKLVAFLERIDKVVQGLEAHGGLSETVAQTNRAARAAADLLEHNSKDIGRASRSLADAAKRIDEFFVKHGESLGEGVDGLAKTAAGLDSVTAQLSAVAEGAQEILTAIREQKGALGRMVYDEEMSDDMAKSVEMLRLLVEDIKRNPQRYLTVKVF